MEFTYGTDNHSEGHYLPEMPLFFENEFDFNPELVCQVCVYSAFSQTAPE